jgi:hypothetical protein
MKVAENWAGPISANKKTENDNNFERYFAENNLVNDNHNLNEAEV